TWRLSVLVVTAPPGDVAAVGGVANVTRVATVGPITGTCRTLVRHGDPGGARHGGAHRRVVRDLRAAGAAARRPGRGHRRVEAGARRRPRSRRRTRRPAARPRPAPHGVAGGERAQRPRVPRGAL